MKILIIFFPFFLTACANLLVSKSNVSAAKANAALALAYFDLGKNNSAEKTLAIAQSEAPRKAFVWYVAAHFYEKQKLFFLADEYFRYAIFVEPASLKATQNYAVFLCRQKKYQAAEKAFNFVIAHKHYIGLGLAIKNRALCRVIKKEAFLVKRNKYGVLAKR